MGMRVDIVTLFPEMCQQVLDASILGRAAKRGYIETHCHQIRDYTLNKQKQTDDYPYGGGCGMVLYAQPIADCLRAVQQEVSAQGRPAPHIVFLTAGGQRYTEEHARRLAQYDNLTLVCGHYEGIDERVIDAFADEEISIGDYILTGGELASLVVADSVLRLKPGVLAEQKGYEEESYWDGLLEYPQYTRPEVWEGRAVPPVLLTGDHKKIDAWRGDQSRQRTRRIVRREDIHDRAQNVRRIVFGNGHDRLAKLLAAVLTADIAQDRLLPRVIHDGVELPVGQIAAADAVGNFVRRVLPHLADENGVRLQLAQPLPQPHEERIRQLVHHVKAVAVGSETEPVCNDAVLVLDDIADVALVRLIDARQRRDPPPAVVNIRILLEPEPAAVRRGRVVNCLLEIGAAAADVAEYAVENDLHPQRMRRVAERAEILLCTEHGVNALVIAGIVPVRRPCIENRIEV